MSTIDLRRVLNLLHDDQELLEHLREVGFLPRASEEFSLQDAETARVAGTLVHELEVNLSGVEVVLHMRSELLTTRRQMSDLMALVRRLQSKGE